MRKQYKTDRTPDEILFHFKRCIVHFAVDDNEVHMCTEIKRDKSFFMPFNKDNNNGAGNPPNPDGIKTDYLWRQILTKDTLSNILENYVQIKRRIPKLYATTVGDSFLCLNECIITFLHIGIIAYALFECNILFEKFKRGINRRILIYDLCDFGSSWISAGQIPYPA